MGLLWKEEAEGLNFSVDFRGNSALSLAGDSTGMGWSLPGSILSFSPLLSSCFGSDLPSFLLWFPMTSHLVLQACGN